MPWSQVYMVLKNQVVVACTCGYYVSCTLNFIMHSKPYLTYKSLNSMLHKWYINIALPAILKESSFSCHSCRATQHEGVVLVCKPDDNAATRALDSRWWQPGFETLQCSIFELLTGMVCGWWQWPQPGEVSERRSL